jgi:hypothetical protein
MAMRPSGPVLFLARMNASNVVPRSASRATATGAFVVDPIRRTISWDLTYQGLAGGGPRSIALYDFGAGANGARIAWLCGDATPCPSQGAANITGTWQSDSLNRRLLGEIASGRVYAEIVASDGTRAIRGQLEPNGAMVPVRNFVAHLTPVRGDSTRSTGTAVLSEVHFADGRVAVFYEVTAAGTSGRPTGASLVNVKSGAGGGASEFLLNRASRDLQPLPSRATGNGGTLSGQFEVRPGQRDKLVATRLLASGSREVGIVVTTARSPTGELYGVFRPVH